MRPRRRRCLPVVDIVLGTATQVFTEERALAEAVVTARVARSAVSVFFMEVLCCLSGDTSFVCLERGQEKIFCWPANECACWLAAVGCSYFKLVGSYSSFVAALFFWRFLGR